MNSSDRPKCFISARRWWCVIACATAILTAATTRPASAGCPCGKRWPHLICHHQRPSHATGPGDIIECGHRRYLVLGAKPGAGKAGCHESLQSLLHPLSRSRRPGSLGHSRRSRFHAPGLAGDAPDDYRSRVILEGRGAVMPPFRGTLTLEEACAMARYLHTFAPGHGGLATRSRYSRRHPTRGQPASHGNPGGVHPGAGSEHPGSL